MSLSGSKVHTAVECPASEILPHVARDYDPEPAERGKAIHRYLERAPHVGADVAIAEAPERFRFYLATIDLDALPQGLASEVAFAFNWKTRRGRELGRNLDRAYDAAGLDRSCEIPCTLDLVGVDAARKVALVRDYKTGHVRLPRPARYGQTLLGGIAAASAYGCEAATLELTYVREDGETWTERDEVDGWDLDTYADRVEATMEAIAVLGAAYAAGVAPDVTEGPHCDYCPAYKACPAKTALVRVMPGQIERVGAPGYLAPDRIAATYWQIQAWKELLGRVEGEIFGLAAFETIDLGDGMILGPKTWTRESYTGEVAAAVLRDLYGEEAAKEAVKLSVSKEALSDAIAKRRGKGKLKTVRGDGLIDRAHAEIRARGGLETTRTTAVKAYRPRAPKGG